MLEALPLGIGLKILRWAVKRLPESKFPRAEEEFEIERIRDLVLRAGPGSQKGAVIVYDNSVSPPTFGDYVIVLMVARYLIACGIRVSLFIAKSELRADWNGLSEAAREGLIREQARIASVLLDENFAEILVADWAGVQAGIESAPDDCLIVFEDRVRARVSLYDRTFNVLNHLLAKSSPGVRHATLLSFESVAAKVNVARPFPRYVAWNCRFAPGSDAIRNTTAEEFVELHRTLRERFPDHSILVVSDKVGCDYFRAVAESHELVCVFSKDLTKTFIEDAALVLGANFSFQVRGGGMGAVAMFSSVPYEIHTPLTNQIMWSKQRACSWQTDNQTFVRLP